MSEKFLMDKVDHYVHFSREFIRNSLQTIANDREKLHEAARG